MDRIEIITVCLRAYSNAVCGILRNSDFGYDQTITNCQQSGDTIISLKQSSIFYCTINIKIQWQSNYYWPYRRIIGIDLSKVSQYKLEKEILLSNQYISISKTENFATDDKDKIDQIHVSIRDV